MLIRKKREQKDKKSEPEPEPEVVRDAGPSLLELTIENKGDEPDEFDPAEAQRAEEEEIENAVMSFKPLIGHSEYAKGVEYTESLTTDWKPASWTQEMPEEAWNIIRKRFKIFSWNRHARSHGMSAKGIN